MASRSPCRLKSADFNVQVRLFSGVTDSYAAIMPTPLPLKVRVQLYCGTEIAMGPGKADLLDAIRQYGSISAAGREMNMSYRRTWQLVDIMNRCWREPLVATSLGRAQGGGARVTPFGIVVLAQYRALQASLEFASTSPDHAALRDAMLAEPKARQNE